MAARSSPFPYHADVYVQAVGADPASTAVLAGLLTWDADILGALELLREVARDRARHHAGAAGVDPALITAVVRNLNA